MFFRQHLSADKKSQKEKCVQVIFITSGAVRVIEGVFISSR